MIKRWAGVLLGTLLLPWLIGYTEAFVAFLASIPTLTSAQMAFLVGVTSYLAWHTMVGKPMRVYVFGHELMHAVAVWLSGGQVKAFKVSAKGGHVASTKTNFVIALAPYLIPVFSVVAAFGYVIVGWFLDVQPYARWFYGGLGATLAFHLVFTVEFVKTDQPDLAQGGRIISLAVIYWVNLAFVALAVSLVTPGMRFLGYVTDGYWRSVGWYQIVVRQLFL